MSYFNNFVILLSILTSPLHCLMLQPPVTVQQLLVAHTVTARTVQRCADGPQAAVATHRQQRAFECLLQAAVRISTLCLFPCFSYFPYSTYLNRLIPLPVLHISYLGWLSQYSDCATC